MLPSSAADLKTVPPSRSAASLSNTRLFSPFSLLLRAPLSLSLSPLVPFLWLGCEDRGGLPVGRLSLSAFVSAQVSPRLPGSASVLLILLWVVGPVLLASDVFSHAVRKSSTDVKF